MDRDRAVEIKSHHAVAFYWKNLQESGGDEEDRTPDLRIANATLSQLSYVPKFWRACAQSCEMRALGYRHLESAPACGDYMVRLGSVIILKTKAMKSSARQ